jgi:hypothetical protein
LFAPWFPPTQVASAWKRKQKSKTPLMWIKGVHQAKANAEHYGLSSSGQFRDGVRHFIAMVIVTIGFAWLWLIEQQKKGREKKRVGRGIERL